MRQFSSIKLFNISKIQLLSLDAAHLLPNTESFIDKLLIESIGCSDEELLGKLMFLHPQPPALEAVILASSLPDSHEPGHSLVYMINSLKSFNLPFKLVEVVSETSALNDFVTQGSTVGD